MRKALPVAAGMIAVTGPLMVGLLIVSSSLAQSQNQQQPAALNFEVASIKVSKSMSQDASLNDTPGGGLEVVNQTLHTLIAFAYALRDDQISGGPSWLDVERYDIFAKAPGGTKILNRKASPANDPVRVRLQNLLAERFHLKVHRETKETTVFALMQDKGGAKLQPWKEGDLPGPSMRGEYNKLTCRKYSMEGFATVVLSRYLGTTVVDKTGLTGEYNLVMNFQPDSAGTAPDAATGPTFLQALHDQLGLKLERQKGTVEMLVIDHAQKPDPN
jgi:uncharacterized protein (TIGR03435 family)